MKIAIDCTGAAKRVGRSSARLAARLADVLEESTAVRTVAFGACVAAVAVIVSGMTLKVYDAMQPQKVPAFVHACENSDDAASGRVAACGIIPTYEILTVVNKRDGVAEIDWCPRYEHYCWPRFVPAREMVPSE